MVHVLVLQHQEVILAVFSSNECFFIWCAYYSLSQLYTVEVDLIII